MIVALLATLALAGTWDLGGTSLRDVAMAGNGVASGQPGLAIPADPASVGRVDGEAASLAWRTTVFNVDARGDQMVQGPVQAFDLAVAAGSTQGDVGLGAGLSFHLPLPAAVNSAVHARLEDVYAPLLEDAADFAGADFAAGVSYGRFEWGFGASASMDLVANTDITLYSLSMAPDEDGNSDITESVSLRFDRQLKWRFAPLGGVHYRGEDVHIYLSYRGENGFRTTGDTTLEIAIDSPIWDDFEDIPLDLQYLSAWSPARGVLGGSMTVGPVTPEATVRYLRSSTWLDTQSRAPEPRFKDTLQAGLGGELDAGNGLLMRTGYGYVPSPVPEQTGGTRFVDSTRHVVGLGGAYSWDDLPRKSDRTTLALSLQAQFLEKRRDGAEGFRWTTKGQIYTVTAGIWSRL